MNYNIVFVDRLNNEQLSAVQSIWKEAFFDTEEFISSVINSKSYHGAVLAYSDGAMVGMCHLLSTDSYKRAYYLYALATMESERGKGIGSLILRYVMCMCKEECASLILHPSSKRLSNYYKKEGFKVLSSSYISRVEGDNGSYGTVSPSEYKLARDLYYDGMNSYGWDSEILSISGKKFISFEIESEYCYAAVDEKGVYEICAPYDLLGKAIRRAASYAGYADVYSFCEESASSDTAVMGYNISDFEYFNFFLD